MATETTSAVTHETITRVQLARGFETIIITLVLTTLTVPAGAVAVYPDGYIGRNWSVSGASFYNMSGGRSAVQGTAERVYPERDDARAFANGWFRELVDKGWRRVA